VARGHLLLDRAIAQNHEFSLFRAWAAQAGRSR
jgi:hypothetical protein